MTRLMISARFAPFSETPELALRHAVDVAHTDGVYRESFGPSAWLASERPATIQYDHDTDDIGQVVNVAACSDGWYHMDGFIETDDPEVLARCKVGTPVSTGARVLTRMTVTHTDTRICRHRGAWLEHIAILKPGAIPGYFGARITAVSEALATRESATAAAGTDWLAGLPDEWRQSLTRLGYKPGDIVELGEGDRVAYRWDGARFVAAHARAA